MFDETYIHYAYNKTDHERIILFCDVERPLNNKIAAVFNHWFGRYVMSAASSPNLNNDRTGLINALFKYLYAVRLIGKRLKAKNRKFYYLLKYLLFGSILYLIFFVA